MLNGYLKLAEIFNDTELTDTERQIILIANNRINECSYCVAAHTSIAQGAGVADNVIQALRTGNKIDDPKLEALHQFAITVNEKRGWLDQSDLDALFSAGYNQQTALEVILGTALKVMSNYTNHLVDTPLDQAFENNTWSTDFVLKIA